MCSRVTSANEKELLNLIMSKEGTFHRVLFSLLDNTFVLNSGHT